MSMKAASEVTILSSVKVDLRTAVGSFKPERNPALDFTKGALVLIMVLYHWVNYFIGPQWEHYQYLRFLTSSFIFITGFLISSVYLSKYAPADPRLSKRLFTRGLKLLAIFLALNAARTFIVPMLGTGVVVQNPLDPSNIFRIFVSGKFPVVGGKLAVFTILVPISYLLMLSAVLMIPYRFYKYTFHIACALLLLSIAVLAFTNMKSTYLESVTIGMVGVLAGFVPIKEIDDRVRHVYVLAFAYACYTIAITIWNVPFPLLIVGVTLSLMVIYRIGTSGGESGTIRTRIILLGKYSLFGYISQIAILQILSAGFRLADLHPVALVLSFLAAFILTILSVEILDRARAKAAALDRLYKGVFA
jgi:peptidoglycan/LPS O-acetylase OafA/YrhL